MFNKLPLIYATVENVHICKYIFYLTYQGQIMSTRLKLNKH